MQPTPAMTIKDCKKLRATQRFDVTAFTEAKTEVRALNNSRQVVSITLLDASGENRKPAQLTFSWYMNLPLSELDKATMKIFEEACESKVKQAFSFFSVQGKKTDKTDAPLPDVQ